MDEYCKQRFVYRGIIDGYDIGERLGAGAMGEVYLGIDSKGREVAVKASLPEFTSEQDRKRQECEISTGTELFGQFEGKGPIVPCMKKISSGKQLIMFMPYISTRKNLSEVLKESNLTFEDKVHKLAGTAQGLAMLQLVGKVHRDMKPPNIMVGSRGEVYIADFGISHKYEIANDRKFNKKYDEKLGGTPNLMPPEQLERGFDGLDAKADVYCLGLTFWSVFMRRRPFVSIPFPNVENMDSKQEELLTRQYLRDCCEQHKNTVLQWHEINKTYSNVSQAFIDLMQQTTDPNPKNRPTPIQFFEKLCAIFPEWFSFDFPKEIDTNQMVPHLDIESILSYTDTLKNILSGMSEMTMDMNQLIRIRNVLLALYEKLQLYRDKNDPLLVLVQNIGRQINALLKSADDTQYRLQISTLFEKLEKLKQDLTLWHDRIREIYKVMREFYMNIEIIPPQTAVMSSAEIDFQLTDAHASALVGIDADKGDILSFAVERTVESGRRLPLNINNNDEEEFGGFGDEENEGASSDTFYDPPTNNQIVDFTLIDSTDEGFGLTQPLSDNASVTTPGQESFATIKAPSPADNENPNSSSDELDITNVTNAVQVGIAQALGDASSSGVGFESAVTPPPAYAGDAPEPNPFGDMDEPDPNFAPPSFTKEELATLENNGRSDVMDAEDLEDNGDDDKDAPLDHKRDRIDNSDE
jgi:serine/threonine protein kinase